MLNQVLHMNADPRPLLGEVRRIVALADRDARDLTPSECRVCDRLLDAAQALAEVHVQATTADRRH
jgi:hypothetical protein